MAESSKTLVVNLTTPGTVDLEGNKLATSATPTAGDDLTNKTYVDGAVGILPGLLSVGASWEQASSGSPVSTLLKDLADLVEGGDDGALISAEIHVIALGTLGSGAAYAEWIFEALITQSVGGTTYAEILNVNTNLYYATLAADGWTCEPTIAGVGSTELHLSSEIDASTPTEWRAWADLRSRSFLATV